MTLPVSRQVPGTWTASFRHYGIGTLLNPFSSLRQRSQALVLQLLFGRQVIQMKSSLTYYMHNGPAAFSIELCGALAADDVVRLQQDWRTASSVVGDKSLVVDLSFVTSVDQAGRELLRTWHRNGARLAANTPGARRLVESMIGAPLPEAAPAPTPTYDPFFTQLTLRAAASL
jgi:hypothetical protein